MKLLADAGMMNERRRAVSGPLGPLAASLAADLAPLVGLEPYVPADKALLSRQGGRCPRDGAMLEFDPTLPHVHRCPVCGDVQAGELHDRAWILWYQLWLAERAVHGALLGALGLGKGYTDLATTILAAIAERYPYWPNRDNVLGPTRPFFSTYLESIWLLQLCVATDLLEPDGPTPIGARVRDRIVEPSLALIASYDEGASNRQVWNVAAMIAASRLLDRDDEVERLVLGRSGLVSQLETALLPDGSWYEGENYHVFAHRGLWYAVTLAERAGVALPAHLVARFQEGFAIPFAVALPDLTLPARRDSQYAISLRQWRFAELCELGLARAADARLTSALARLYAQDIPRTDPGRARSAADAERHAPATSLTRADLGWRSLLCARPELPPLVARPPQSVLLESQGLGILRRDRGRVYLALDYGHSGGGHGHPDRLNVMLSHDATRWLDDMGTGSYVDPSLHWYRSSLAHSAPFVNGRSQDREHGWLVAWDERPAVGWINGEAPIAPGVRVVRSVVAFGDYAVDALEWASPDPVTFDLPLHLAAELVVPDVTLAPGELSGSAGLEDGFRFVEDAAFMRAPAGTVARLRETRDGRTLNAWCGADEAVEWWRAVAPGPPGHASKAFWLARSRGLRGRRRTVLDWSGAVRVVRLDRDRLIVELLDGSRHEHLRTEDGWHVQFQAAGARSTIDLGGLRPPPPVAEATPAPPREQTTPTVLSRDRFLRITLGEAHYRRSEQGWRDAGSPRADVTIRWTGSALDVRVQVERSDLTFAPPDATNPYDNEQPDVNGDGVQLYVDVAGATAGWMLVPEPPGTEVRVRPLDGWGSDLTVDATWRPDDVGYLVDARITGPLSSGTVVRLDVIVNEKPRDRERRRGQLVLSGGAGDFVYLRGDRQSRDALRSFVLE